MSFNAGAQRVPVLMYHQINDTDDLYATSAAALTEQMDWLAASGYTSIAPSDLYRAKTDGTALPAKPVILTIDDGHQTDHLFADVLLRFGFRGCYFWPDTAALSETEMSELAARGEIGGHTRTHRSLDTLSRAEQTTDIEDNLVRLRQITGQAIRSFAYPYGAFNTTSTEILGELGVDLAFDAHGSQTSLDRLDRLHVPRIEVSNRMRLAMFIICVESWS